jgi:alkylation response protein AidB-like acyl-CoA dehydrogenase
MTYTPPVADQKFVLRPHRPDGRARRAQCLCRATPDVVMRSWKARRLCGRRVRALNRDGDTIGARWTPEGVTLPPGFSEAYQAYVEGGWGTLAGPVEYGGQGLPLTLATVVMEDLGAANMAFSLIMMLTPGTVEALKHHGSEELKAQWLPKLVTGEWSGTMNLTEPQAAPTSAR